MNSVFTNRTIHFFSQLVYLDTAPSMVRDGKITVAAIAEYYIYDPVGMAYLAARFSDIPREYGLWKQLLTSVPPDLGDFAVIHVLDDNKPRQTGFYGCTFLAPTGEKIVAFRGSEMLGNRYYRNDYVTDLALTYQIPTPQQAMVDTYWKTYGGEDYSKGIAVTGHSLGGNLAVYGAIVALEAVQNSLAYCAAFNAPGFCPQFLQENQEKISKVAQRIALFQNQFDLVSSMLSNPVPPVVVASAFNPHNILLPNPMDILYPHSNFMYQVDSAGNFLPTDEKCGFCEAVHTLTDLLMMLPPDSRKEISDLLLDVLYFNPAPEKNLRYLLEALLKSVSRSGLPVTGWLDTTAVLMAAKLLPNADNLPLLYQGITAAGTNPGTTGLAAALLVLLSLPGQKQIA